MSVCGVYLSGWQLRCPTVGISVGTGEAIVIVTVDYFPELLHFQAIKSLVTNE